MSARYEGRKVGVLDRSTGRVIVPMDGAEWAEYHDWLAAGGVPDPEPGPDPISLEEALARMLAEIEDRAADQRRLVTGNASPQEMASWTVKRDQALQYDLSQGDASAPMLAMEAKARGVATADIVARVRENADAFSRAEAAIAGVAGRHKDALRLLETAAELLAYDAAAGWPFTDPRVPAPGAALPQ